MPEIRYTPQDLTDAGTTATYNGSLSTSNTYKVVNDGRMFLHFKKSGAGSCTVTLTTPVTFRGKTVADSTVVVPASTGDVFVGPFVRDLYNDGAGDLTFTVSEITGLTVAVLQL